MAETAIDGLKEAVRDGWARFIDEVQPFRADLFGYGRRLTGNAFDAEDLVHDALLRAFATLGMGDQPVRHTRAYLFRVLTNLWVDELRRSRPESWGGSEELPARPSPASPAQDAELRDAAETALGALPPRERAAVVLKEAFDLGHAEIAEVLSTSESAVKVALHRGRRRLASEREGARRPPRVSRELVDRFVAAFRAHDLPALRELLAENAEAAVFPAGIGLGVDYHEREGWLNGCLYHHDAERKRRGAPYPRRLEVQEVEGEPVVLVFQGEPEALEEVWRFEETNGRISHVRDYGFSPSLVRFVAETKRVPFRELDHRVRPEGVDGSGLGSRSA